MVARKKSLKTFVTVEQKLCQSSFQNKKLKVPKLSSPANDMLLNKFTGNYTQGFASFLIVSFILFFFYFDSCEKKSGVWSFCDSCPDTYVSGLR